MGLDELELFKNIRDVIKLKFSDGIIIHTNGPLRTIELKDGWYVVGEGKLIPISNEEEGF
jgi:hypothetical protein